MSDGIRIWTPQTPNGAATVAECIEAYREFLRVLYPQHLKAFDSRRQADPDSACAEAVVFSVLRTERQEPSVAEVLGSGGPDFLCLPGSDRAYFLEVTSLDRAAVERRSDWPDKISDQGRWFGDITRSVCNKCAQKAPQLAGRPAPRVLAICTTHSGASVLLGTLAAEDLMTPEASVSVPDGASAEEARRIADMRVSPFLEIQDGNLVPVRRSISAILLVTIHGDGAGVLGLLHPDPAAKFDYRTLAKVPFLRFVGPVQDGAPRTEWVVGDPEPKLSYHRAVSLSDAELQGETLR
jgi:hypothetical protein